MKTEVLIITTQAQIRKDPVSRINIGQEAIVPAPSAKNLGVVLDSLLKMEDHVSGICRTAYYHIHNIYRIRHYIN